MIKKEFFFPSSDNHTNIHAIQWIPDQDIVGIVQIAHGMVDHIERYDRFARYLCDKGYLVVGNDHLGHGQSVQDESYLGYFGKHGNQWVIQDMHQLYTFIHTQYPNTPYFLLGHSMGSFLVRQYIMTYQDPLQGAIIMGTGYTPTLMATFGKGLCRIIGLFKSDMYRSKLVDSLGCGGYAKGFEHPHDWLTKDTKIIEAYESSPLTSFVFTMNGYEQLLTGIQYINKHTHIKNIPASLPILFVSGKDDPVGNKGKGVQKVYEQFKKQCNDVTIKLYENDRHEILNELDHDCIDHDLFTWLERHRTHNG